jgi:lysophospholipase L1-like esterase
MADKGKFMSFYNNLSFRNFGKNSLLFFLSMVVALSLVEISLRVYNPLGFRIKGDKVILPINKNEIRPHNSSTKLDKITTIHRNSLGFRGEEPPPDFARRLTIVTIGGSTTECRELADEKTWPQVLAAKLRPNFDSVWLNNAGLSGHSTFGHLVLVQDYIAKLGPNVAIFLVGVNDVGSKAVNKADKSIKKGLTLSSFRSLERFLAAMSDHSEVAAAMLNLKRYFFPKIEAQIAYNEIDLKTLPILEMPEKSRSDIKQMYQKEYLGAYKIRLDELIEIVKQNNIIPIMVTQPALYGDAVDDVTGVNLANIKATKSMDGRTAWEVLEMYNDITRETCKEKDILLIDLAREMPKSSKYYYDLVHYTNAGAERVAGIIYERLQPFLAMTYQDHVRNRTAISFR